MYTQHVPGRAQQQASAASSESLCNTTARLSYISAEFVLASACLDAMWSRHSLVDVGVWVLRRKAGTR